MECMCHTLHIYIYICAAWSCTDRKARHRRAACETERTDGRCSSGRRSTVSELRLQRHAGQSAERNPAAMQSDGLQLVEQRAAFSGWWFWGEGLGTALR
jgi:hypothetical protein